MAAAQRNGEMQFHDAANIFPLDDDNLDALADDIREQGQQVEIEILDGKVLDGRRRWLACKLAGKKPLTKNVQVDDPIAHVLSLNRHRRHLSETQLAMVAARARELYDAQAKQRQREGASRGGKAVGKLPVNVPEAKGDSREAAGRAVGVSGKSVDYATKVLRGGSEELIAAVESDKVAVSTAARMAGKPEQEQREWLETAVKNQRSRFKEPFEPDDGDEQAETKRKGVGIIRANEAINCLIRIPKNDALRKRGFQVVTDWIRKNR